MTTVFPPLPCVGGFLTQKVLSSIPVEKPHDGWCKPSRRISSEKQFSPSQQTHEIKDTAKYRNSFLHNLCVEMLKDGYHLAFRELFDLVKTEKDLLDENVDHAVISIEDNPDNLTYVKEHLIAAEVAMRLGHSDEIYKAQLALSKFFESCGNFRLAHHFYTASFNTSKKVRGDGRRSEAEANCNLGTAAERDNDYLLAELLYLEYYSLTRDKEWKSENGETLHKHACDSLIRVYITLSEHLMSGDEDKVLEYLHKAYKLIKDNNESSGSHVVYLLGKKYDLYGNHGKAVEYLTEYLELCKSIQNSSGMGKAYQALACSHQRQGNMEEAACNLKMFINVMERSGEENALREACSDLGALYNYVGKYEQSSNFYKRAFQMAQKDHVESSRCDYGIALAHGLLNGEIENITRSSRSNLESLLNWKSERMQGFSKDEITYSMYKLHTAVNPTNLTLECNQPNDSNKVSEEVSSID